MSMSEDKNVNVAEKTPPSQRLLNGALRLYPKPYRTNQASEIAGTYTARTAAASRTETLREALDVAGHALRVRLRLTTGRYAGAVLAAALPYVLGGTAGLSGYVFYLIRATPWNDHHEGVVINPRLFPGFDPEVVNLAPLPLLASAIVLFLAALAGRWTTARWLAAITTLLAIATIIVVFEYRRGEHISPMTTFTGFELPLMLAAFSLMVLAVPPDTRTLAGHRLQAIALALAVAGLLHLAWVREGFAWSLITAMPAVVTVVLSFGLLAGLVTRSAVLPGAVALSCVPWLIQPLTGDLYDYGYNGTQYVLLVAAAIVLILAGGSFAGRSQRLLR